jgi:hypothetical protein
MQSKRETGITVIREQLGSKRQVGMRAIYIIILVSMIALSFVYNFRKSPRLLYDSNDYDFGEVKAGEIVQHTFNLRNGGTGNLVIKSIKQSCSCINTSLVKTIGENLALVVTLKMPPFRMSADGVVTVETNDSVRKNHRFVIKAQSSPFFEMYPRSIDFGFVRRGDVIKPLELDIVCKPDMVDSVRVDVRDVADPSPVFAKLEKSKNPNNLKLTVGIVDGVPGGPLTASLFLSFGTDRITPVEYGVRGIVRGDVTAIPAEVFFEEIPLLQAKTARVELQWIENCKQFEPTVFATFGDPGNRVKAEIIDATEKKFLVLSVTNRQSNESIGASRQVRVAPPRRANSLRAVVQLRCKNCENHRLNLPLIGFFAEQR